jgi:hypothetical protein
VRFRNVKSFRFGAHSVREGIVCGRAVTHFSLTREAFLAITGAWREHA